MIGFEYYNPAKIVFGEGSERSLVSLLKDQNVKSLLLVYSGAFIKELGIYGWKDYVVPSVRHQIQRER